MRGDTHLPRSMVRESGAVEMPAGALRALGANLIDRSVLASVGVGQLQISASSGLPNKVYALTEGEGFFVLPTGGERKSNQFSGMCALVFRGNRYLEALQQLNPKAAAKLAKRIARRGGDAPAISDFRARQGKHEVSLVLVDGWTSVAVDTSQ